MSRKITTIAAMAIHAPFRNLVMSTTTSTVPDIPAPTALITRARSMAGFSLDSAVRSSRFQCRIMPIWLVVNETNTPTM
ncbi:hypothetical protein GCM10025868_05350 [Angustibacter aerolatus]|uniref:Uncharacterized protein n=1 Tax=Angustibacter aerolatus TaxID=1162965 RepID=A0ABQ6JEN6_9ACTN|nr:hypothetical protein GCM10025868_05350 [Angustibacter aerolatus]